MQTPPKKRFHLISPSTRQFLREGRSLDDYTFWDKVHGLVYARWIYLYIGMGKGDHPFAKKIRPVLAFFGKLFPKKDVPTQPKVASMTQASHTIADGYHGKALPLETAKQLISINQDLRVDDLEQVIPYVRARAIVLQNPDHIAVMDCPCRASRENPCLPMDVCMVVGEPFASYVIEHHPEKARWIDSQEAVQILEAEDARGHVHHAFFKDAMLGRFYAICNCCSCCCGAIGAHQHGTPMLASSGYLAEVDGEMCIGCAECQTACQFGALSIGAGEFTVVDTEKCMGCGVCLGHCPLDAIQLTLAPSKGIPLEIETLMTQAAAASTPE